MTDQKTVVEESWHIVMYGDGDSIVIHRDDDNRVCFMATHGGSRKSWELIQRDAKWISATPDLIRALAGMLDSFGGYVTPEVDAAITAMQKCGIDRWSMDAQMKAVNVGDENDAA